MQFVDFKLGPRGGAKERTKLDGVPFVLEVVWNTVEQVWALTISDANSVVLRAGLQLRHGEDVLEQTSDPRLPSGKLRVWDVTGRDQDPGRLDLRRGSAVRLVYITAAEAT